MIETNCQCAECEITIGLIHQAIGFAEEHHGISGVNFLHNLIRIAADITAVAVPDGHDDILTLVLSDLFTRRLASTRATNAMLQAANHSEVGHA